MNFLFLFVGVVLLLSSFIWGDALGAIVESCPSNSIAPAIHSPECFTCPYIGSFRTAAGSTAHICFEESSESQEFKCMCGNPLASRSTCNNADAGIRYETTGYTNSQGEVVPPREIGQCLYSVSISHSGLCHIWVVNRSSGSRICASR